MAAPDVDGPRFPAAARGFRSPPVPLDVPALVVASLDDPYATSDRSRRLMRVGPRRRTGLPSGTTGPAYLTKFPAIQ